VSQVERKDGVARLKLGEVHGRIGLRPGVRLHVDVVAMEEFLGPVAGKVFGPSMWAQPP